jgi:hypothetical protein
MNRRLFLTAMLMVGATALTAVAQTPPAAPPTRVRGTIDSVAGNVMTVNGRDGQKVEIILNDPLTVATVKKVELSAIKDTDFIGTATRTGADGKLTAIEVLVFPETMRGAGEGFYPWDLEPGSMMTNGTVKGAVTATSGRDLTVTYKDKATNTDKSNTVNVPPTAAIVTFAPAAREDLKPGAPVFIGATKNAEGKLAVSRVTVGKDGVAPPM